MMLAETPTVVQRSPVSSELSISTRVTACGAAIEDAHAIVGEFKPGDEALIFAEVLAQREIERIDRTDAFGDRNEFLVADFDLHHRLANGDGLRPSR